MRIFKLFWKFGRYLRFWLLGACQLSYDHHIDMRQLLYVETTNFYIFYVSLDNRHILRTGFLTVSKFLKMIFFWIFWILSNFLCVWSTTILKAYETSFYAHEEFFHHYWHLGSLLQYPKPCWSRLNDFFEHFLSI